MRNPGLKDEPKVPLIKWNEKVQTFAAQHPAEALAYCIRLWRAHRRSQHPHTHGGYLFVQLFGEDAVPVVNEESIRMTAGECLAELLCGPFCRRVSGDIVVENSSATQFHNDEHVQCAECGGDNDEEVAGDHYLGMVSDEGQPTLLRIGRTHGSATTQVLSDSTG